MAIGGIVIHFRLVVFGVLIGLPGAFGNLFVAATDRRRRRDGRHGFAKQNEAKWCIFRRRW